eukprot:2894966-Amphidinium_carterae.1
MSSSRQGLCALARAVKVIHRGKLDSHALTLCKDEGVVHTRLRRKSNSARNPRQSRRNVERRRIGHIVDQKGAIVLGCDILKESGTGSAAYS